MKTPATCALVLLAATGLAGRLVEDDAGRTHRPTMTLVAPATCELGGRCEITVRVACPDTGDCTLLTPGRLGAFELLQVREDPRPADGFATWRLTIIGFEPGRHELPPMAVHVAARSDGSVSEWSTEGAVVEVAAPADGADASLRALAAPLDPGRDWRVMFGALAAGVLTALGIAGGRRLVRNWHLRRTVDPTVEAAQILTAIRSLERMPGSSAEDVFRLYGALSRELRRFFRVAYSVPAEALTSTELVRAAAATLQGRRHAARCRDLLTAIDRVKFAGELPGPAARRDALARAVDLVLALAPARDARRRSERRSDVA